LQLGGSGSLHESQQEGYRESNVGLPGFLWDKAQKNTIKSRQTTLRSDLYREFGRKLVMDSHAQTNQKKTFYSDRAVTFHGHDVHT
jgi:hypothetical protein